MTRSFRLGVQALEAREVPTVVTLDAGILRVTGTDSAESITVRQSATHLTVDGEAGSWAVADVSEVWVEAFGGADTVSLQKTGAVVTKQAVVFGGAGDDKLHGGNGADHLDGGSGTDHLFGYGGNDRLAGDTGDDVMFGGSENDQLAGGGGKDILLGEGGTDRLDGGREFDSYLDVAAGENVHDDWGGWANNIVGSGYTHHQMLGVGVSSEFGWYDANTVDVGLRRDARAADRNGTIDRTEMIALLRSAGDSGSVSADELDDLKEVTANESIGMSAAVRNLSKKVVHGDRANQWFTGGVKPVPLGNLAAGLSDDKLERLVGKWFLGTDRPLALSRGRTEVFEYKVAAGDLFVNGPTVEDINQGDVGDCYLLAAAGAITVQDPELIEATFTDNGDGTFTVRFFKDGKAEYVTVDRGLPVRDGGRTDADRLVFASEGKAVFTESERRALLLTRNHPGAFELWVPLLEKAYAQLNESGWTDQDGTNSYTGVNASTTGLGGGAGDVAMRHLAGVSTTFHTFWFTTFGELKGAFDAGKAMTFATGEGLPVICPVVGPHEYIVTGYDATQQTIRLRNPWGEASQVKDASGVVIHTYPLELELTVGNLQDLFMFWCVAPL